MLPVATLNTYSHYTQGDMIMHDLQAQLFLIADELRSIASLSDRFAANIYETERASRIMELAAKVASLADHQPAETVKAIFDTRPWHRASPAVGVEAVVFNPDHEILLIQRRDNAHWALPGGIAEVGQTFPEAVLRELWEEAGMRGEVKRLLGIFDARLWQSEMRVHMIDMLFHVECQDLTPHVGIEALDAAYFAQHKLPTPLHHGHSGRIGQAFKSYQGETYFDPASSYGVEMPMHQRPSHEQ